MSSKDVIPSQEAELISWGGNLVTKVRVRGINWNIPGISEEFGKNAKGEDLSEKELADKKAAAIEMLKSTKGAYLLSLWDRAIATGEKNPYTIEVAPGSPFDLFERSFVDLEDKYKISIIPDSRTKSAIQAKNDAKRVFIDIARQFLKEYITYNSNVTNKDRDDLNVTIHKEYRSKSNAPTDPITIDLETKSVHRVRVGYHHVNSRSTSKPQFVTGVFIVYAISNSMPTVAELSNSVLATRSPQILQFNEEDAGKTVYVAGCWQNRKGQRGPWSSIEKVIIP
jgi:hypothetical protein